MIKKILNTFFVKIWMEAFLNNIDNIISLLSVDKKAVVLDVGCGDGKYTIRYKKKIKCKRIMGADGVKGKLFAARKNGVDDTVCFNFEGKWPFPNNKFDVVVSDQVIEHILNLDNFISEVYRILKPGGYCVISTENLSSTHNVLALILGYQDFSHHLIMKKHVGNPLALHHNEKTCTWGAENNSGIDESAFPHIKIPTFKSLRKIFEAYNFKYKKGKGSGYYPLCGFLGRFFSNIDPYHSHFITVKMQKPSRG